MLVKQQQVELLLVVQQLEITNIELEQLQQIVRLDNKKD
jgi:hypothetical protein